MRSLYTAFLTTDMLLVVKSFSTKRKVGKGRSVTEVALKVMSGED